ncbi:HAD-IA family hydrolase [Candidatus Saccharibacteria bacterium]|nr:HAD-IA family hydrolase [Candidatus Saccharibacteria bacterium]
MIILSDLSEVLISGLNGTTKLIYQAYGKEAFIKCWQRIKETEEDFNNLMRGKMTEKDYYEVFFANNDFPFTEKEMRKFFSESFQLSIPGTLDFYRRIVSCPKRIHDGIKFQKGMPDIYIVSDHIAERIDEIKGYHPEIFDIVKGEFWSCELGRIKRDPHFFEDLLKELNVDAREVIFIDDSFGNILAARRAGIYGIHFMNADQLNLELFQLGFDVRPKNP